MGEKYRLFSKGERAFAVEGSGVLTLSKAGGDRGAAGFARQAPKDQEDAQEQRHSDRQCSPRILDRA